MTLTITSAIFHEGWAFYSNADFVEEVIGYFFLLEFFTMTVFTFALIYQVRQIVTDNLRSETRAQLIIFSLFTLSYLCRFIWCIFLYDGWIQDSSMVKWVIHDAVIFFDGFSLLALLLLHHENFREIHGMDSDSSTGVLRMEDYIFCPDDELDSASTNHSLILNNKQSNRRSNSVKKLGGEQTTSTTL